MTTRFDTLASIRAALEGGARVEDVIRQVLDAVDAEDGALRSFATLVPEMALAQARALDEAARLGVPRGPLFGMPVGVKDIIDVAGLPTKGGSLTRADAGPAQADAEVVTRLRAAGAIILGKTATVEYAFGGWGTNETLGTPLNPWDRQTPRTPGGSSNGSGVAVGAGLVPAALGSDTGGSIRLPASFSGVVGLKTTRGLVSTEGVLPLSPALDTIGPLAGCVADAAAVLAAIALPPAGAAAWGQEIAALAAGDIPDVAVLRVGLVAQHGVELHPDTAAGFARAVAALEALGASVREVRLPEPLPVYNERCGMLMAADAYRHDGSFAEEEPNRLGPPVRRRIMGGKAIPAWRLLDALDRRGPDKAAFAALFESVDVLLTPTTRKPAPTLAELDEDELPGPFTRFVNWLDLPAASVPVWVSAQGLPVAAQIIAPSLAEPRALRVARALEAASGGPLRAPR